MSRFTSPIFEERTKNSAHCGPDIPDAERAAFPNLVLLCTGHHKLVDRLEPKKYTAEKLNAWKEQNEPDGGLGSLDPTINFVSLKDLALLLGSNPQLRPAETVPLADIRNVGLLPATVEEVNLDVALKVDGEHINESLSLISRNDVKSNNPPMSYRLRDGDSG